MYTVGVRPSASIEAPGLTLADLRRHEGKDPVTAALASILMLMPRSESSPTPGIEVATAEVRAWMRAAGKGKGQDAPLGSMLGATLGEDTFEIPHGEMDWSAPSKSSEWEPNSVSEEPTPPEDRKKHERLKPGPGPRAVAPEPTCLDRGLLPRMSAPNLHRDETMDLLSRVLGAGDEDPDLSALSAALKTKLGLSNLESPPSTISPAAELLTRDVKAAKASAAPEWTPILALSTLL